MTNFKIETGIPIPALRSKGIAATLRLMKVGQSALFPKTNSARVLARKIFGAGNFVTRTEKKGVRVWRTK